MANGYCKCGAHWTGDNRSHCSACHNTFGGVTTFDNHRYGDFEKIRKCRLPEKLGLRLNEFGIWVSAFEQS